MRTPNYKTLLISLLFCFSHPIHGSEKKRAQYLASQIPGLSYENALIYLPEYLEDSRNCIKNRGYAERVKCGRAARAKIFEKFKKDFPQKHLKARLKSLRRDGHLIFKDYPTATKPFFGIVGDSLATGSLADLSLEPHVFWFAAELLDFAFFEFEKSYPKNQIQWDIMDQMVKEEWDKNPSLPPLRVFDTPTWKNKKMYGFKRRPENKLSAFGDCEECSFATQLATNLGFAPSNIIMAAQSGKKVKYLEQQLLRTALPTGKFPDIVLISFNANDACRLDNLKKTPQQKYEEYLNLFYNKFIAALQQTPPASQGTHFIVVAAADYMNVLTNESILNRVIPYNYFHIFSSQTVTCRDLRNKTVSAPHDLLSSACKSVLRTPLTDLSRIAHLNSLHRAMVQAQADAVHKINQYIYKNSLHGFKVSFVSDILDIKFTGEDVSHDCFHPSLAGHQKISNSLLKTLENITSFPKSE